MPDTLPRIVLDTNVLYAGLGDNVRDVTASSLR